MTLHRTTVTLALAGSLLAGYGSGAQAAITGFSTQAGFLGAVTGAVVDTFDNLPGGSIPASPLKRTLAGGYGYTATEGPNYPYFDTLPTGADKWLPAGDQRDTVTFAAFTGGPGAIGGNFFDTAYSNIVGVPTPGRITVTAVDSFGATFTQTITGATQASFLGFVSTGTIVSLSMFNPDQNLHATVDNLTFAAAAITPAVPEPASVALLAAGLVVVGLGVRRRRAR